MVFQVLNRLKWAGELGKAEIVILHRGAPQNRMSISGGQVTELKKHHFTYLNRNGDDIFIPLHRILEVRMGGKTLWDRKNPKGM